MYVTMSTSRIWLGSIFERLTKPSKTECSVYFGKEPVNFEGFSLERLFEIQGEVPQVDAYELKNGELTWRDLNRLRLQVKERLSDQLSKEIGTFFTDHAGRVYLSLDANKIWMSYDGIQYITNRSLPSIPRVELKNMLDIVGTLFNGIPPFEGMYSMNVLDVGRCGLHQEDAECLSDSFLVEISSKKHPEISTWWIFNSNERIFHMVHRDLKTKSSVAWPLPGSTNLLYKALERRLSVVLGD